MIKNWNRFQHYKKNESPAWIKLYVSTLNDISFRSLRDQSKLLLFHLWVLSASNQNKLDLTRARLARACGIRVKHDNIKELIDSGFLVPYESGKTIDRVYTQREEERRGEDILLREESVLEITDYQKPTQVLINRGLDQAANTRKSNSMSDGIRQEVIRKLTAYPEDVVIKGTEIYLEKHRNKPEKYWIGIIRGEHKQREMRKNLPPEKWEDQPL